MKDHSYIKIIEIKPINYNLKSEIEKEAILNSYKTFLKTCNFNIQIIVQSNKENLSKNILKIQNNLKSENENILKIANIYINYIKDLNLKKESLNKKFYILIKNSYKKNQNSLNEKNIINELNDNYFKIKESLMYCGNEVVNIEEKEEILKILESFLNLKINSIKNN